MPLVRPGNRPVRRRFTIRQLDAAARLLTLDIVLHGDGPGERWVGRPGPATGSRHRARGKMPRRPR
jgi:NADPH-dependent ferric siderophore reductase